MPFSPPPPQHPKSPHLAPPRPFQSPPPQPTLPEPPPQSPPREPALQCPPPPPPPSGASGEQLLAGIVGVYNRGVAPPYI